MSITGLTVADMKSRLEALSDLELTSLSAFLFGEYQNRPEIDGIVAKLGVPLVDLEQLKEPLAEIYLHKN